MSIIPAETRNRTPINFFALINPVSFVNVKHFHSSLKFVVKAKDLPDRLQACTYTLSVKYLIVQVFGKLNKDF